MSRSLGRPVIVGGMGVGVRDGVIVGVLDGRMVGERVNVKTALGEAADMAVLVLVPGSVAVVKSAAKACTVSALSVLIVGVTDPLPAFTIMRSAAYNFWLVELTIKNGRPNATTHVTRSMR